MSEYSDMTKALPPDTGDDSLCNVRRLRAQIELLRGALEDLSAVCTCDRPAVIIVNEDGRALGTRAPGPHTARCVRTRALRALSEL